MHISATLHVDAYREMDPWRNHRPGNAEPIVAMK